MSDRKLGLRLEADGELPDLAALEVGELLYCTQCGTINPANARFCRKCGDSLEEQQAESIGLATLTQAKRKKAQPSGSQHNAFALATLQVITMFSLGLLSMTALVFEQAAALIPIILAWFLTEAVRQSSHKGISIGRAVVSVFTILLVAFLGMGALVFGQGGAIILLMLAWFLIEAVRYHA
ncbi:MAG: hypothetical protein CUN49_06045 [Candidatus Thermofonsia Clade 1 bacterium]|jgi:RNA polymerase subunit RPABC4/transcription elongation factor Spt4|uniref:Zinc-ribbon domain-containing protein n=1 Tax=Candidatus Thermofonsia Clade 1 bacterium TaxID=2364210 RepID=A0A2M8PFL0_9CHLR|nr:MAG: hypothetical protein CUN49_06045 [Candidatus Thermofonsia Clade 1 bacterium]RMF53559.1 MAG: zinc ribbon domain-containing protein [Chloroflexota bacterium]